MTPRPLHFVLRAALEFGPLFGFVVVYLLLRNKTFLIAGAEYSGLLVVVGAFIPVFLISTGTLWVLTGKVARIQVATLAMFLVTGGMSLWLNDPRLIKMKPTLIYLCLAFILCIGLVRGQSWLKYIMEDMIPLKRKGWMILTKRVTVLFFLSAGANELVWRTQSEEVWVFFETLVMPIVIFVFFLSQIGLYVDYVTLKPFKKKR